MNSRDGYQHARYLLEKEYGDNYRISMRYVDKLLTWPKLEHEEPYGFKRLSVYLTKCCCAMESINDMSVLNHTPNLQAIVRLLPEDLQQEWREYIHEIRMNNKPVLFRDLSEFIERISDRVNHPVFGTNALKQVQVHEQSPSSEQCHTVRIEEFNQAICPLCQRPHDIEQCEDFTSKDLEQRRAFLRENCRCFSCYGVNHISRNCITKRTCRKCGKPHPTAMHNDNFRINK